jgi:hypothetical protein
MGMGKRVYAQDALLANSCEFVFVSIRDSVRGVENPVGLRILLFGRHPWVSKACCRKLGFDTACEGKLKVQELQVLSHLHWVVPSFILYLHRSQPGREVLRMALAT